MITTRTQPHPFDAAAETAALTTGRTDIGAIVTFTGLVRDVALTLEHYPTMTNRQLAAIAAEALTRWPGIAGTVIHRFGTLAPGDPIVLVAIASAHRAAAFEAAEFLMDWLKTRAPFWKHEAGAGWVAAKSSDDEAAARWDKP
ncbi:molybdenum cofactor biosynthesis protein MoaE [Polymorphobacter glacialis]|uniref:Molybdopterin synthase catalytic subunit n=1 Tax=Sandarakinorhabdus glacialis TaxID=1614636 RepID=A0A916ZI79_9SPHN|nr:molybdenum cofactor biosynthesis protein MoaE [Polymorphobacter glacialis]GGD99495.1 molybdenum cofactor biosynthesis protein MoaE [Polymorphobacter glacialis]